MKLIKDYENSIRAIEEYVGLDFDLSSRSVEINTDDFWKIDATTLYWGTKEDVEEESGNHYESECVLYKGERFSVVVVESDFGEDDYVIIFDNDKNLGINEY